jgi:hypothetical protein
MRRTLVALSLAVLVTAGCGGGYEVAPSPSGPDASPEAVDVAAESGQDVPATEAEPEVGPAVSVTIHDATVPEGDPGAGNLDFDLHVYPTVGSGVNGLTAADLDGDGDIDLAVSQRSNDSVSVLLNNGHGAFAAPATYAAGDVPTGIASADFDGDGDVDLATGNRRSDDVSVFFNDGRGAFAAQRRYGAVEWPFNLVSADFDGDGRPDLAAATHTLANPGVVGLNTVHGVSVFLNRGDGAFSAPIRSPQVGPHLGSLTAADFDGDGDIDLAVPQGGKNTLLSILFNEGNGTFAAPVDCAVANNPHYPTSADLDGDGDPDLAVVTIPLGQARATDNSVWVLLNQGGGTFAAAVDYPVGNNPEQVTAADFDGDGDWDLAVPNAADGNVSFLRNHGNGTFDAPVNFPSNNDRPHSTAAADFDGDGDADLAVGHLGSGAVALLRNTTPGAGATTADFTVMLSAASDAKVTVDYATADETATAGIDYRPTRGTLTFAPGVMARTISVSVIRDTTHEPDETFSLHLSSPSGATIENGQARGSIADDDGSTTATP